MLREFSLQMRISAVKFHQMNGDRLNFPTDSYYIYLNMHKKYGKQRKNKSQVKLILFVSLYINGKLFNCVT